jgi:hypothetical protein
MKISPKGKLMGEIFRLYMAGILVITLLIMLGVRFLWIHFRLKELTHVDERLGVAILLVTWVIVLARNRGMGK